MTNRVVHAWRTRDVECTWRNDVRMQDRSLPTAACYRGDNHNFNVIGKLIISIMSIHINNIILLLSFKAHVTSVHNMITIIHTKHTVCIKGFKASVYTVLHTSVSVYNVLFPLWVLSHIIVNHCLRSHTHSWIHFRTLCRNSFTIHYICTCRSTSTLLYNTIA